MPTMAVKNRIWKKRATHIWMILPEMQAAKTIQNLPVISITGDSQDARDSRGVRFISSGNWLRYLDWQKHCRSWVVVFITAAM